MEEEIKRMNFFDGQFLKEDDFKAEQYYLTHMRRRINYTLFEISGVISVNPNDLKFEITDGANHIFRVNPGMAISRNDSEMEYKEIILRQDSPLSDRTKNLNDAGISSGETAYITIHYEEQLDDTPPSEGDMPGDTRVKEKAVIDVFSAKPTAPTPDGEEYIYLGSIDYDDMQNPDYSNRDEAKIRASLVGLTPSISLSYSSISAGSTNTVKIIASNFDLSTIDSSNISFNPPSGITNISSSNPSQQEIDVSFDIPSGVSGNVNLIITKGATILSGSFMVQPGLQLSGFKGVDVPGIEGAATTRFTIFGSGFTAPAQVKFSKSGGGFTTPVLADAVTANSISVEMAKLDTVPETVVVGPVEITVPDGIVDSNGIFDFVPPAIIDNNQSPDPDSVSANDLVTIIGKNFFIGTSVLIDPYASEATNRTPNSQDPFPSLPGEIILNETKIVFKVMPGLSSSPVVIKTNGGYVQTDLSLDIT